MHSPGHDGTAPSYSGSRPALSAGLGEGWGSAQFLELLSPETADPLERDEEVFTKREWLLEMKLKNISSGRSKRKEIRKETAKKAERKGKKKAKERALRRRSQKRRRRDRS